MKKFLSFILMLCTCFLCFSACKPSPNTSGESSDGSDSGQEESNTQETEKGTNTVIGEFEHMSAEFTIKDGVITAPKKSGITSTKPQYSIAFSDEELTTSNFAAEVTLSYMGNKLRLWHIWL